MTVHHFPSGGRVPPSEAREGDSCSGAVPRAFGDIAADARGPLRQGVERVVLFAAGALFVVGAFVLGLMLVLAVTAVFVAYLTIGIVWSLRAVLIGLAFAFVIAKIVGLL